MTYDEVMARLKELGNESVLKQEAKRGPIDNQFGVKSGDLRDLAKLIKSNPALAAELWKSGNVDAMILATQLMKPKMLSLDELDSMLKEVPSSKVADALVTHVIKPHPQKDTRREVWMDSEHDITARIGWSLTTERVIKNPDGLDLTYLLDRIDQQMGDAPSVVQWTMNYCLAEIGILFPQLREHAIAIGAKIGAFRNYPVSKGCVSPFAPIWIQEMVKRGS